MTGVSLAPAVSPLAGSSHAARVRLLPFAAADLYSATDFLPMLAGAVGGPTCRLRRSVDGGELDFIGVWEAPPYLWSEGGVDLLSWAAGGSAYVRTRYDQTGHGHNEVQPTQAAQPRIVNAGVLDTGANGRPVMVFDGVNDKLSISNALGCARNVERFTIAANADLTFVASSQFIVYITPGSGVTRAALIYASATIAAHGARVDGAAATSVSRARAAGQRRFIARLRYADAEADIVQDGAVATGAFGTAGPTGDTDSYLAPSIGDAQGGGFMAGKVSTLVLARSALDIPALDDALARLAP